MATAANSDTIRATFYGFTAILMWALLALLTDLTGEIPPFQLAAMTFLVGTIVGLIWRYTQNVKGPSNNSNVKVLLAGGIGLFAYHALYFAALKSAPAAEASLIAYLWPLLIVVCSALLPGERIKWHHIVGATAGFIGTFVLISGGTGVAIKSEFVFGYTLAFAAAFTWTAYSLLSRRFRNVPTSAVISYCAISTVLATIAHLSFETSVMPQSAIQWFAIIGLGLLPVGAAFYLWDHGMKYGNVQVLGASSYAAPLLSTIILVAFARTEFTWPIALACVLITLGALVAAKDIISRRA